MKMIQVRNVPDELHRSLKARAAREGRTLSDLILSALPRLADKPSPEEVMARIRRRDPVGGAPRLRADRRRARPSLMLVVDASALTELILGRPAGEIVGEASSPGVAVAPAGRERIGRRATTAPHAAAPA